MLGNVIKSRENDDVTKLNRGEAGGPVSCCSLGRGSNVDRLGLRGSPPRGYVQLYAAALTSGEGFQPEEDRKGLCSTWFFLFFAPVPVASPSRLFPFCCLIPTHLFKIRPRRLPSHPKPLLVLSFSCDTVTCLHHCTSHVVP